MVATSRLAATVALGFPGGGASWYPNWSRHNITWRRRNITEHNWRRRNIGRALSVMLNHTRASRAAAASCPAADRHTRVSRVAAASWYLIGVVVT